ncbi:hypothetical protein Saur08_02625 [Staphylococcus aureus]
MIKPYTRMLSYFFKIFSKSYKPAPLAAPQPMTLAPTLMQNRTTIIIAHRLSTIKNADQIIFLDNGKITGIGNHHSLFNNHEKYKDFVLNQHV